MALGKYTEDINEAIIENLRYKTVQYSPQQPSYAELKIVKATPKPVTKKGGKRKWVQFY